jgi:diguanylate cyclase (GGDEF)-like protein
MTQHAIDGVKMTPQDKPIILIADDSRVVRVSLKNILKNDCHLIEAEDGQQAWEQLLENPAITLIFSDLCMPRLDGRGLLNKIRNSEIMHIRSIPFIAVTGNEADNATSESLQDMGATEVISKPFDPTRIVSFVSTLVSQQESESYMLLPKAELQTQFLPNVLSQNDFIQTASKELSFAIRNKNELAIALLRIDQFEQLLAHYSDTAIEHILLTTVDVIRQHIHPDDTVAYFGDGLFAILRPASNAIGTRYIGRRVIENMAAKQFYLGESSDLLTISIGISAPRIKPGIRLKELLLLAEGKLIAAMDLGGNRVIDKGNDTLTPVGLVSDSTLSQPAESEITSHLQSVNIRSSHFKIDTASWHGDDTQRLEDRIEQLQSRLQSLTSENKDLQAQVERWHKQSGESELLRQRVFELESEQQQMQLKLNEFANDNYRLQKLANETESNRQKLQENEEEKSSTLKQANQFYEQENLRLEGQLETMSNRAQKAELAYRKSEQLVISLKDNVKLMRSQIEHLQHQLVEAQTQVEAQSESVPLNAETAVDMDTDLLLDEGKDNENRSDSNLQIDGFPSNKLLPENNKLENNATDVDPMLQLFAKPSTSPPRQATAKEALSIKQAAAPAKTTPFEKADISIPVYRVPEREKIFKEYRPLSSFTIASLLMLLLLVSGSGYFYVYWRNGVVPSAAEISSKQPSRVEQAFAEMDTDKNIDRSVSNRTKTTWKTAQTSNEVKPTPKAQSEYSSGAAASLSSSDEGARLQAEQTLRQIAEKEFTQRLRHADEKTLPQSAPTARNSVEFSETRETAFSTTPKASN